MKSNIPGVISLLLLTTIFSCSQVKHNKNPLSGNWKGDGIPVTFSVNDSLEYKWIFQNGFRYTGECFVNKELNQLLMVRTDGGEFRFMFELTGDYLILWNNKMLPGIHHHIDEVIVFHKEGTEKIWPGKVRKEKYVLPSNFTGKVKVGFEEKDFDDSDEITIKIPDDGCTQTDAAVSIKSFAFDQYEFHRDDHSIPFIKRIQSKYVDQPFTARQLESMYVFVDGFNQSGRDELNVDCQMNFTQNVLMFRVDTLRNLLKTR